MASWRRQRRDEALDQAARWMARLVAGGHRESDRRALQAWLDEATEHRDAWWTARSVWYALDAARGWCPEAAAAPGRPRPPP